MDRRSSARPGFSSKGSSRWQQNGKPAGKSTTKASGFAGKLTTDGQGSPKMTSSESNSDRGEYRESRIPQKWSPSARKKRLQNSTPAIPPEFWNTIHAHRRELRHARKDVPLMPFRWRAQVDRLEDECKWNHQTADDCQCPEHIDISEEVDLPLQGLAHPRDRL
jgi:hypothetical protein